MPATYPIEIVILPRTTLRRERLLPCRGEVLVRPGDSVLADQVVCRCQLPGRVYAVDASQALGIRREEAVLYVRQATGAPVRAGDILAERRGRFGRRWQCLSPVDGRLSAIRNGVILVETASADLQLRAQIRGQVAHVLPERGVIISAAGALVQGVWGNGGEAVGHLELLVKAPDEPLRADSIHRRCQDALVVGGWVLDQGTLQRALEVGVRGVILGSVPAELVPLLRMLPCPVLVTEGFDRSGLAMSEKAFSILQSNAGREAALSADRWAGWGSVGPELLIPLGAASAAGKAPPEDWAPLPLQVGVRVRGLRAPYGGMTGTVRSLPPEPLRLESGCRQPVAEVELEDGHLALIPLVNLAVTR